MRPGRTPGRRRLLASSVLAGVTAITLPALAGVVLLGAAPAMAQDYTSGILSGVVSDETGAAVSGATVTVTSAQGAARTATTDADGAFRVPALAVGGYSVKIEKAGFGVSDQRVSVAAASNSAYDFTLITDGATVDEVVVTASRVSDFSRNDTGMTVDVQELSEKIPVGRSIAAVTMLTPGATAPDASINASSRRNQGMVGLSGTTAAESVTYINGLNVQDQRNFLGYADLPFDSIQAIETKTGGYQAEFGRATGGVVNIVTRSGSNEFEAGASAFWTPNSLRGERGLAYTPGGAGSAGGQAYNEFAEADTKDYSIWAAGPLIKDHVFFFANYNIREVETTGALGFSSFLTPNGTLAKATYNDPRWLAKMDFVLNENHRLEATVFSDATSTLTQSWNYNRAFEQTSKLLDSTAESGGLNQIYKYTGVFTDWFTLSALYGKVESSFLDSGMAVDVAGVRDYYAGGVYNAGGPFLGVGRHGGPFNSVGQDTRDTYRIDADFYFDLFGDHHLRVGYDREDLVSESQRAYSGGGLYYAASPNAADTGGAFGECGLRGSVAAGCIRVRSINGGGVFEAEQSAWYIQDSWQLTPDLSVQIGFRNDLYEHKNSRGESYIQMEDQIAPRLGFNWDPTGEGTDRVYGSMGDYYLPVATNTSIRASSLEVFEDRYFNAVRDGSGNLVMTAAGTPQLGAQLGTPDYLTSPYFPDPRTVAEPDLKPMYEREFILGYEHRFTEGMFADWTMGLRYIHRDLQSAIEDTAIGDAVVRYCARNGITCNSTPYGSDTSPAPGVQPYEARDFSSLFPYVLVNPGDGAKVFIDLNGDGPGDAAYNPQWINLTAADLALPEVERMYQALEFTFERPFDGVWGLQGSYTLGKSYGNYEGAIKSDIGQTDTSLTQDFDHASNMLGAKGYLPNHRRHTFKVFGNYAPTDRITIGANFTAQSGRPYGCNGFAPANPNPAENLTPSPSGTPGAWYCPIGPGNSLIATPRGSQGETNWTFQTDLNLGFKLYESETLGTLTGSVDVFNLFDSDTVQRVVEQGVSRVNNSSRADNYGMPRTYQAPRTVRVGLRYRF